MQLVRKILAGDELRRTRLHTEDDRFVGWLSLPGLLPAAVTWGWYRLTGKRLARPWWVWGAISFLERNLRGDDRVLEIGGGYSTIWLAQQCSYVYCVEESSEWAEKVKEATESKQLSNVEIVAGDSLELFHKLVFADEFDILIIDGPQDRLKIFDLLLGAKDIKWPRLVVFDDTDRDENTKPQNENFSGYDAFVFRGFKPQTVHACETTVFRLRNGV